MNTDDLPALIDSLHGVLIDGKVHREHELLKQCESLGMFALCSDKPNLALFQKHFVLMHALYLLRRDLFEAKVSILTIDSTRIRLLPWPDEGVHGLLMEFHSSEKLEAYYLDFSNVIRETEGSVASMLGQFWRRYAEHEIVASSDKDAALDCLGLSWPFSEKLLKRSFRERAHALHPDKGGNPNDFIRLRRSYETLKKVLRQSNKRAV